MTNNNKDWHPEALDAVRDHTARVAVVGCGYVGLSVALGAARAGFTVTGIEADESRAKDLAAGVNPVPDVDVPPGELTQLRDDGRLTFTDTLRSPADIFVVCVPTPLRDGSPDLHFVEAAGESIARVLRHGALVVLESTTYPGTTEELLRPILEEATGLRAGESFALGHSPERIDPGNRDWQLANTPKVVGGFSPACTELAAAFYGELVEHVVPVSSPRAAEMSKLLENTYRHVNIALANEMSIICQDLDIDPWEVIDAAASKPFGFTPFRPGPGVGGHCLLPDERIIVRRDGQVQVVPIERLWEDTRSISPSVRLGNVDVVQNPGLDAASLEGDTGTWNEIEALGRRHYRGDAVRIRTRDGRTVAVTADHRMLVHENGSLCIRAAAEIQEGDLLPVWRGHEEWEPVVNHRVDLLENPAWADGVNVGVRLTFGDWRPFTRAIRLALGEAKRDDVIRTGRLPLETFLQLDRSQAIQVPHEDLQLWTGRGPSARSFPAVVELTPDIARLVGYYASEGCITDQEHPRTVFTFHREEVETKDDLKKLLGSLGLTWSVWEDPNNDTTQIKVSNRMFAALLRDVLGCGTDSYDARVPTALLGSSAQHRRELLAGLLRGDGSVHVTSKMRSYEKRGRIYTHRFHSAEVGFFSVNEDLAYQTNFLMLSLGYVPSLRHKPRQAGLELRLHGSQDLAWLTDFYADVKRERLERYVRDKRRHVSSSSYKREGEFHLVPVVDVERRFYEGPVYSLEVRPSHSFATGNGLVIGNCIPVDPQYLAWRVRGRLGHQFRLLETADDVNQRMPAYVVQRAGEILNDQGKAIRGANVLILGVAYKGGSADVRESPSLRVIERLERSGAEIRYHDPYVPAVTLNGTMHESVDLTPQRIGSSDLVMILTDHPDIDYVDLVRQAQAVFDTRGVTARLDLDGIDTPIHRS